MTSVPIAMVLTGPQPSTAIGAALLVLAVICQTALLILDRAPVRRDFSTRRSYAGTRIHSGVALTAWRTALGPDRDRRGTKPRAAFPRSGQPPPQ